MLTLQTDAILSNPRHRLLNVREVARIFRLSPRSVRRRALRGELPRPVIGKKGRVCLWRLSDIQAFIDALRDAAE